MTQITVRKIPDDVKTRLRVRAAKSGRSLEAEVRVILSQASTETVPTATGWEELRAHIRRTWKGKKPKSMVDDLIAERRREAKREAERGW